MTMQDPVLEFKGIREGILVTVPTEPDWGSVLSGLATRIDNQAAFFRGASLVLQLNGRGVQKADIEKITALLDARDVKLVSILSESATTRSAAQQLGLAIDLTDLPDIVPAGVRANPIEQPPPFPEQMFSNEAEGSGGILINHTVRSGRRIHSDGHVVILGDVNPGAEVVAGGDIVIWGKARGIVHAGALGNDECVICALDLQPTQLRISSFISVSPPKNKRRKIRPEMARVRDGHIEAESWEA